MKLLAVIHALMTPDCDADPGPVKNLPVEFAISSIGSTFTLVSTYINDGKIIVDLEPK